MARRIVIGLAVLVAILGVVGWFAMRTGSPSTVVEATAPAVQAVGEGEATEPKPESPASESSTPTGPPASEEHVAAKKKPQAGSLAGGAVEKKPAFKVMAAPPPPPPPPAAAEHSMMSFTAMSEPTVSPEPTEALEAAGPSGLSPTEAVGQIIDSLEAANIAFNAPRAMVLGETTTIQLALSMERSIEELKDQITAMGEREGHAITVSDRMQARLTGANFRITAITPEEQAISSKGTTTWSWDVQPTGSGRQSLHLSLTALIDVGGHGTQHTIGTFDKNIDVNVTWQQQARGFVTSNWQWLWAALLVPGAGWIWRRRRQAGR